LEAQSQIETQTLPNLHGDATASLGCSSPESVIRSANIIVVRKIMTVCDAAGIAALESHCSHCMKVFAAIERLADSGFGTKVTH